MRFHLYQIPEEVDWKDAVWFAYVDSMQRGARNKLELLLGDVDSLYMFDEKRGAGHDFSRNTISVEMIEEGHEIVPSMYGGTTR